MRSPCLHSVDDDNVMMGLKPSNCWRSNAVDEIRGNLSWWCSSTAGRGFVRVFLLKAQKSPWLLYSMTVVGHGAHIAVRVGSYA